MTHITALNDAPSVEVTQEVVPKRHVPFAGLRIISYHQVTTLKPLPHSFPCARLLFCHLQKGAFIRSEGRQHSGARGQRQDHPDAGYRKNALNPYALDAADLISAMKEDVALGRPPIFMNANVGSTNTCAIDPLSSLARGCRRWEGRLLAFRWSGLVL